MDNTKNTIIGFVLIFAILIGYYFITAPSKEELQEQRRKQDSILMVQHRSDSIAQLALTERMKNEEQKSLQDSLSETGTAPQGDNIAALQDQFGSFALSATGAHDEVKSVGPVEPNA